MSKNIENNDNNNFELFIEEKRQEAETLQRKYEQTTQDFNISYLLLHVLRKIQNSKYTSFSIDSYSENGSTNNFITYEDCIEEFMNLFNDDECLKLDIIRTAITYSHIKDLIFLLNDYTILIISFKKDYHLIEGDIVISATIRTIGSCKGNNYTEQVYHRDPYYCSTWYEPKESFTFRDESNKELTNKYAPNDITKSYQNIDIREILKEMSIEDIIERILSTQKKASSKKRILTPQT